MKKLRKFLSYIFDDDLLKIVIVASIAEEVFLINWLFLGVFK